LYQANVAVRRTSPTAWLSAACSTARNGPTSLPVGLMTPTVAARISSGGQLVRAKTTPATTISPDPTTSTRRRPSRSAFVVSQSEMSVSPTRVRVRVIPTVSGSSPIAAR
jgi:hypothetical protein